MTLQEVKEKTEKVFDVDELKIPEPAIHWKDRLESLDESKLTNHHCNLIFDMRVEQVETMGFVQMDSDELVDILMGSPHNELEDDHLNRQNHEWAYNHHTDEVYVETWGSKPTDFYLLEKKNSWWLPPFGKKEIWRCRFGKLDHLKRDIPFGVVLRINELKDLKIFNAFSVLAPIEAWERKTDIDPIVVATIWEMPFGKDGKCNDAGEVKHFFIAQW